MKANEDFIQDLVSKNEKEDKELSDSILNRMNEVIDEAQSVRIFFLTLENCGAFRLENGKSFHF